MERLGSRPIVHYNSEQATAYMNTSSIWRGRRMKGREREGRKRAGRRRGQIWRSFSGTLSPHELQPVGEKLTESVPQPCRMLCTANHNFKISRLRQNASAIHQKCAFSRVNNEQFPGKGAQPPAQTPLDGEGVPPPYSTPLGAFDASILAPSALDLAPPSSERNENWCPPTFWNKVTPCFLPFPPLDGLAHIHWSLCLSPSRANFSDQ